MEWKWVGPKALAASPYTWQRINNQNLNQQQMKRTNTIYWIFTGLLAAFMLMGAIPNLIRIPQAVAIMQHLGYPVYLLTLLGVAKILGVVAILVPGYPRIREWAYAGFVFDLTGAMFSGISVGDPASGWAAPIIDLVILVVSYIYYHKRLAGVGSVTSASHKSGLA
jgi:uncharacterized membrane protein YphA (DoxX/SURF4 family)